MELIKQILNMNFYSGFKVQTVLLLFLLMVIHKMINAQVVKPGDWSSLRLYGHAFNVNGFSEADYDWIKNHNYLFTTEKRNARNIYGDPSSEQGSAVASAQIKENNPETKPLFYWNASVIYDGIYESIADSLPNNQNWIGDDGRWNYSDPSFRNWWVDVASNQINNNAEEGIFIDAVPNVYATNTDEDYAHFLDMMDQLPGFVLYNVFFTSQAGRLLAGLETLEHADGVYVETFLHFNCDTPEKGKQMLDALLEVPEDKFIITNNLPEDTWNATDHQFGMAAHLIIANDNSFHRYYLTGGYDQSQLTIWHEDFGKYIGEPLEKATVDGYVYTRTFENAFVTIDLLNKTSSIVWGENVKKENLALNGTATQSSTAFEGDASRAIDGNTNGAYSGGSVSHTSADGESLWQVALDSTYSIGDITVFGRTDTCCADILSDFTVYVYDDNGELTFSQRVEEIPNPSVTVNANNVSGNVIKVQSNTGQALALAEVEVYEGIGVVTSLESEVLKEELTVFPNPAIGSFRMNESNVKEVQIFSVSGELIKTFYESKESYLVNELNAGAYLVKVTSSEGKIVISKLLIED